MFCPKVVKYALMAPHRHRARPAGCLSRLALGMLCTLLLGAHALAQDTLKLATWNLEWLMTPATFDDLARTCRTEYAGGEGREIPCDIVLPEERSKRRSPEDFVRLREYARRLDADVVALQEVDGPDAARLVFPDYEFCFTHREHVQNVGFAVRRGIGFRCADYAALGLESNSVRWGAVLTLYSRGGHRLQLLAVHLKSRCQQQLLTSSKEDCRLLAAQVPVLKRWIDARVAEGSFFVVLGDFNRRFARERHSARDRRGRLIAMWPEIDGGNPGQARLTAVAMWQPYRPCRPWERHDAFIDNIVLGATLATYMVPGSFEQLVYDRDDARDARLSDHCPIAITLRLPLQ